MYACPIISVFRWVYPFRKLLNFSLLKLHILPHLIEIFPTVYGWCLRGRKVLLHTCFHLFKPVHTSSHITPIRLWWCTLVPQLQFLIQFSHFKICFCFSLTSYPAEIAYFRSPNRELSNFVRLMELYRNKIVNPSRSPCLKIVDGKRFEHRNFLVLRPVLLKNACFSSANWELSKGVWLVKLG